MLIIKSVPVTLTLIILILGKKTEIQGMGKQVKFGKPINQVLGDLVQ